MTNVISIHWATECDCCNRLCRLVLSECAFVCVRLLVPSDGYNRFWAPHCEWLTQSSCLIWNTQSNATWEPSDTNHTEATSAHTHNVLVPLCNSLCDYLLIESVNGLYYNIQHLFSSERSEQKILQLWFRVMQFVKLKQVCSHVLTSQAHCWFCRLLIKTVKQNRDVFIL